MPNFIIIGITIVVGLVVLQLSAKSNEKKFKERRAAQANPPQHEMVDNQPSGWAWALAIVIAIVGTYLAMPH